MSATLLVELLTEELPPKALKKLGEAFAQGIYTRLQKQGLCTEESFESFATPRRLAVALPHVLAQAPTQRVREKILPVSVAFDAQQQPSQALIKKLNALGCPDFPIDQLERVSDDKVDNKTNNKIENLFLTRDIPGLTLAQGLQIALQETITTLPIPKVMSYQLHPGTAQEQDVQFVRPAHQLIALHAEHIVPVSVLGLQAGRTTVGHRFLSTGALHIDHADHYADVLHDQGKVIASYAKRQHIILEQLTHAAGKDQVLMPHTLLDEVTALVEWPAIYTCHFDKNFLRIPQECLILTMQTNQKYFALTDAQGKLHNRFLVVSNIQTDTPQAIIEGNERVIKPRLADAQFFFEQDQKKTLSERIPQLASMTYHNKLGSQLLRCTRLVHIATHITTDIVQTSAAASHHHAHTMRFDLTQLPEQLRLTERAARLAKVDLLTQMVGEFPELQGVMGTYYARAEHEPEAIALACSEHYHPRFAGDTLPAQQVSADIGLASMSVALADKLETLIGIWSVGGAPSGEKDPYALRRHGLGIVRILAEKNCPLDIKTLLSYAAESFDASQCPTQGWDSIIQAAYRFLLDRMRSYLREQGGTTQEVEAVLAKFEQAEQPAYLDDLLKRLDAVRAFAQLPQAPALAAANKRISNLLKKTQTQTHTVDTALLEEPSELALYQALQDVRAPIEQALTQHNFTDALCQLASLRDVVDHFFSHVMVMTENKALRDNRIALLTELHTLMNHTADLSRLVV
ncbi:MAG: glycine--tRNA ligase subunit beta [Ottowia sp.]|nr:glycine--tRNA ligase subunit beta [Ottowia sp.]